MLEDQASHLRASTKPLKEQNHERSGRSVNI
jgi:hypothetical protein